MKIYKATLRNQKYITRECSNCKNRWSVSYEVEATASDPRGYEYAEQEAREKMTKILNAKAYAPASIRYKDVLCEKCNHFSEDIMNAYFKNGYAKGISKICWEYHQVGLGCGFVIFLIISLLILFTNLPSMPKSLIIFSLLTFIILIINVIQFISYKRFEQSLKTIPEEKLLSVCVENYKNNNNAFSRSKFKKTIKLIKNA